MIKFSFNALAIIIFISSFASCKKTNNKSELELPDQDIQINLSLNLSDQDNEALNVNGGYRIITIENKHVIVCRKNAANFWAKSCDCNASVHSSNIPVLTYLKDQGILKDNVCGSEYDAISGVVIKSPATLALKAYTATLENGILKVN
jgi:hypothetical protein